MSERSGFPPFASPGHSLLRSLAAVLVSLVAAAVWMGSVRAEDARWTFSQPGDRFAADAGTAGLDYFDAFGTGWGPQATFFGKATSFGLPPMADGDPDVMEFPACGPGEGYRLQHNAPPNGVLAGSGLVANYSLILDVLFPETSDGLWRSLYQTSTTNANDGDLFVLNQPAGGIGIGGRYHGSVRPDTWHRIVLTVRAAPGEGQLHKFIDGTFVGGQGTTGSAIDDRWALEDVLLLFADESGDTAPGYVAGVRFIDRQLTMDEVRSLGGPSAMGPHMPGPAAAAPFPYQLDRAVDIIAHRGNSCCAPENTLPALEQAFDRGARYIECDTRLSADGVAVLMHDATLDRTTDGSGAVASRTVATLKQLDAGSWFDPSYAGTRIPTLEEALVLAKQKGGTLYLDLKVTGAGPAIKTALANAGVAESDLWLWVSTNATEAAALRTVMPEVKLIWGDPPGSWPSDPDFWDEMRALGVHGFDLASGTGNFSRRFALAARSEGFYISNYTILDPDSMIQSAANGANGIETDFIDILHAMQPPYSIEFYAGDVIPEGTPLGPQQLNATADIPGAFSYDPPAGTILPLGEHPVTATFQPDDAASFGPRSVTVTMIVSGAGKAAFELDKPEYVVGEAITATWTNAPGNPTDWIGIYSNPGCGPVAEEYVCPSTTWLYVSGSQAAIEGVIDGSVTFLDPGLPEGEYIAYFLREDGYGWIADPVPFTVTDPRPSIESFTAEPLVIQPGGSSVLRWTIDPRGAEITRISIDNGIGEVTGDSVIVRPSFTTIYTLEVESAFGPSTATVQVFVEEPTPSSLALDNDYYLPGQSIVASWASGPGNPTDWIGIYRPGQVPGNAGSTIWLYVSGTQTPGDGPTDGSVTFDAPGLPEGDWIAYFFEADGYTILAGPVPFKVDANPPLAKPFVITEVAFDGDDLVITWNSKAGRTYRIEAAADLKTWLEIDDSVPALGDRVTYRLAGFRTGSYRFVRVGQE